MVERGVLANEPEAFKALLLSLSASKKWSPTTPTYAFIDNCMSRIVRQPIHYLDLSVSSFEGDAETSPRGTLLACIAEQWPFVAKSDDLDAQKNIAEWISRFFSALGRDEGAVAQTKIDRIRNKMIKDTQEASGSILEKALKKQSRHPIKLEPSVDPTEHQTNGHVEMETVKRQSSEIVLEDLFGVPARSPDSFQGLDRWEKADLEPAVSSGRLSRLLQCVASMEEEIRRQAFLILRQLMVMVKV